MRIGNSIETTDENMRQSRSFWQDAFIRFKRRKIAVFGFFLLSFIVLVCIYGFIAIDFETQVISQNVFNRLQPPSREHPLGTDSLGRDVLARLIYASRYSLFIGFSSTIFSLLLGGAIGAVSAYFGGKIDNIAMRLMDILIAIPFTLLAIAIVAALGASLANLIIAIALASVPAYARVIRSSVLSVKGNEFIEAAVAVGSSHKRIIMTHIIPNAMGPLIVQATMGVAFAILSASALSYLGLGISPPTPEWGNMLAEGQTHIRHTPWLVLFPGIAIALTVLSLNLIGDGIQDAVDPKLKN